MKLEKNKVPIDGIVDNYMSTLKEVTKEKKNYNVEMENLEKKYKNQPKGRKTYDVEKKAINNKYEPSNKRLTSQANLILKSIGVAHIPHMGFERMEEHLNQTGTLEILRLVEKVYGTPKTKVDVPVVESKEQVPLNQRMMTMQNFQPVPEGQSEPKTSTRK